MLDKQNNILLRQFTPWGDSKPIEGKCIYEIEQVQLKPGNLENWANVYAKKIAEKKGDRFLPYPFILIFLLFCFIVYDTYYRSH